MGSGKKYPRQQGNAQSENEDKYERENNNMRGLYKDWSSDDLWSSLKAALKMEMMPEILENLVNRDTVEGLQPIPDSTLRSSL